MFVSFLKTRISFSQSTIWVYVFKSTADDFCNCDFFEDFMLSSAVWVSEREKCMCDKISVCCFFFFFLSLCFWFFVSFWTDDRNCSDLNNLLNDSWNDFEIMSDFFWWEIDDSDIDDDDKEWFLIYLNLFKCWNNSFTFCNFFTIDEIFIFSYCLSICFEFALICLLWILVRKEKVVTFFLSLFLDVKNWFFDVQICWKMIDD